MSRHFVKKVLKTGNDKLWNVSYTVGITAEEILSKIADKIGVYVPGKHTSEFLGRGWMHKEMYDMLMTKNFSSLPPCRIPADYQRPPAGELGLCSNRIVSVDDMSVWAGTRTKFISKLKFLQTAEKMLEDLPPWLSYYWDKLYPTLCHR